jgi:hypothetical protein
MQSARAASESPPKAVDQLVEDALAFEGARAEGLDHTSRFEWAAATTLARRVVSEGLRRATDEGPPRDDELEDVRVAHAVVLRGAKVSEPGAIAIAEAIRVAAIGSLSADEFEKRALATPHGDARVIAEELAPFRADGRAEKGAFDDAFVAAAFQLRAPRELSDVIESPFGWHVIFLVDRVAPSREEQEERRSSLGPAVTSLRARAWLQSVLRARRKAVSVEVLGFADALLSEVKVP